MLYYQCYTIFLGLLDWIVFHSFESMLVLFFFRKNRALATSYFRKSPSSSEKNWIIAFVLNFHFSSKRILYFKNVFTLQYEIEEPLVWVLPWGNAAVLCVQHYCNYTNADNARRIPDIHLSSLGTWRCLDCCFLHFSFGVVFFFVLHRLSLFFVFPPRSCIFNLKMSSYSHLLPIFN